jgi:hypothetical protein
MTSFSSTMPSIVSRAIQLIEMLRSKGVKAKLFGSCAIWESCKLARPMLMSCNRIPKDIDFVIDSASIDILMAELKVDKWVSDEDIKVWSENKRMRFRHLLENIVVDVCVDHLNFAQTLSLRGRLESENVYLSPSDLLLSKIQIVDKTTNDYVDIIAILISFEIGADDDTHLCLDRIKQLRQKSWRWMKAFEYSVDQLENWQPPWQTESFKESNFLSLSKLRELVVDVPKARHGIMWYQEAIFGGISGKWFNEVEIP